MLQPPIADPGNPAHWREAEVHLGEFDHVAGRAHDRSHVVDPDVVRLGQIEFCLLRWNLQLQSLHIGQHSTQRTYC